jgi:hypothetical protein
VDAALWTQQTEVAGRPGEETVSGSKIIRCSCVNQWQDQRYGAGMRVHTRTQKGKTIPVWRCTICLSEKESAEEKK